MLLLLCDRLAGKIFVCLLRKNVVGQKEETKGTTNNP
jgi:hypothetical protein